MPATHLEKAGKFELRVTTGGIPENRASKDILGD
jgi:hypothetical protein